ncbi:uncharacterized protein LOC126642263 [Myiozetetes cayanensis]|uniref:uncharacterized protein LOC126642263 n=1 Tax=Myiozetetes cayanensis TaxID=478635 RepID=UPI00215ED8B9|nr:uncharacterized protein LOC126642263 [Myiozetetes cayanensis]
MDKRGIAERHSPRHSLLQPSEKWQSSRGSKLPEGGAGPSEEPLAPLREQPLPSEDYLHLGPATRHPGRIAASAAPGAGVGPSIGNTRRCRRDGSAGGERRRSGCRRHSGEVARRQPCRGGFRALPSAAILYYRSSSGGVDHSDIIPRTPRDAVVGYGRGDCPYPSRGYRQAEARRDGEERACCRGKAEQGSASLLPEVGGSGEHVARSRRRPLTSWREAPQPPSAPRGEGERLPVRPQEGTVCPRSRGCCPPEDRSRCLRALGETDSHESLARGGCSLARRRLRSARQLRACGAATRGLQPPRGDGVTVAARSAPRTWHRQCPALQAAMGQQLVPKRWKLGTCTSSDREISSCKEFDFCRPILRNPTPKNHAQRRGKEQLFVVYFDSNCNVVFPEIRSTCSGTGNGNFLMGSLDVVKVGCFFSVYG